MPYSNKCVICGEKLGNYDTKWIEPIHKMEIICDSHAEIGMDHTTLPEGFQHWRYYTDG